MRRPHRRLASVLAVLAALLLTPAFLAPTSAASAVGTHLAEPTAVVSSVVDGECGASVASVPARPRQVNLVLDDSGSMFSLNSTPLDRWSSAKYSLEVFASMLGPDDTLNVFRMSDFSLGSGGGPAVTIAGAEPASQRVAKIHRMTMQGGGTPYAPVSTAMADLAASTVSDRWLVILSDGEFNDRETSDVEADFASFVAANTTEASGIRVAFLAIGAAAPELTNNPAGGVFFQRAAETSGLLTVMTEFSNRIFARSILPQSSPGKLNPDVDLDEVLVFAQGGAVELAPLRTGDLDIEPTTEIEVAWSDNPPAVFESGTVPAVPNQNLRGTLASYRDVPAGALTVVADGAQNIDVFYTPRAAFGITLTDSTGEPVEADKIVGGDYTVDFGFMDRNCDLIKSDLYGATTYSAQVIQNGEVTVEAFSPGDVLTLERGEAQFNVTATYLQGNTTEANIDLTVLRPAKPTAFEETPKNFRLSELQTNAMPADAMELRYAIEENGQLVDFAMDEWASFTDDSFDVSTSTDDIDFEIRVGAKPGQVFLLPRAPGGEPLAAAHGDVPVTVKAEHVYDEQLNAATFDTVVTIEDDYSFFDHLVYWFLTEGWIWLLLLLAAIWILGYFVRPTFSRRIKQRPTIAYKPKSRGKRSQLAGKFEKNRLGALIPYKARTATLNYAPRGFSPMKLKAARGGRIEIQNWKQIAERGNVRINGEVLDKQTPKAPVLRPAHSITAIGPDGAYDMTLNA